MGCLGKPKRGHPECLKRNHVVGGRVRVLLADDCQHPLGVTRGNEVERFALVGRAPRHRHADHPVERNDAVEGAERGRLERVHPAHTEPDHHDAVATGFCCRLLEITQTVAVVGNPQRGNPGIDLEGQVLSGERLGHAHRHRPFRGEALR